MSEQTPARRRRRPSPTIDIVRDSMDRHRREGRADPTINTLRQEIGGHWTRIRDLRAAVLAERTSGDGAPLDASPVDDNPADRAERLLALMTRERDVAQAALERALLALESASHREAALRQLIRDGSSSCPGAPSTPNDRADSAIAERIARLERLLDSPDEG